MKNYLLLLSVMALTVIMQAQHSFQFIYNSNTDSKITGITETQEGRFLAAGYEGYVYEPATIRGLILDINPTGDTAVLKYKSVDTTFMFSDIRQSSCGGYDVFGTACLPPGYQSCLLVMARLDDSLHMQWFKTYPFAGGSGYYAAGLKAVDGNGYHILALKICATGINQTCLVRIDRNGKLKYSKTYTQFNVFQNPTGLEYSSDSSQLYLIGVHYVNSSASVISTDSMYDILSIDSLHPELSYCNNLVRFNKNKMILTGTYSDIMDPEPENLAVGFTGPGFNDITLFQYGSPDTNDYTAGVKNISFHNPDSIFLLGSRNYWDYPGIPSWICIYRLDSNLAVQKLNYFGGDACYYAMNILATSDGGCLVTALRYPHDDPEHQQVQFIKFKKEDLVSIVHPVGQNPLYYAVPWPNPGTDWLQIRIQSPDARFTLYTLQGEPVARCILEGMDNSIKCGFLPSGTYIYSLETNGMKKHGKWIKR